jgi:glycosyltransferase involved in cell wall biosynthesis
LKMISVIIPTLQEEKYIEKTLSNLIIFAPKIEIIVVDGGSTDRTVEIAKLFTDKVFQIGERGISKAKNYGAKRAKGEILVFLDADVIVPHGFLEKVLKTFENRKVVGATCHNMPVRPKPLEFVYFSLFNLLTRFSIAVLPKTRFKYGSRGEFMAVRKSEFFRVGGFNEKMACLEDYDLTFRISGSGKFVFIEDLTVYESMRRVRKFGLSKISRMWTAELLAWLVYGVPKSKVWRVVR